jgi:hypothetical protein
MTRKSRSLPSTSVQIKSVIPFSNNPKLGLRLMKIKKSILPLFLTALLPSLAHAQETTVNYSMAIAGLPIGSATMVLMPNGNTTAVSIKGHAGGPFEIGKMSASGVIAPGQVQFQSQSGSGKSASSATLLSRGAPGSSNFTFTGQSNRGPGKIAMTLERGKTTLLDVAIPDSGNAVRVPVTDAHKSGVIDPLSLIGQFIKPGGTLQPESICDKQHAVFTGQVRYNLAGSGTAPANTKGLPEGWNATGCKVTFTPVSGYRIDKNKEAGKPRVATLVFAQSPDRKTNLLWSFAVPAGFGSFSLNVSSLK